MTIRSIFSIFAIVHSGVVHANERPIDLSKMLEIATPELPSFEREILVEKTGTVGIRVIPSRGLPEQWVLSREFVSGELVCVAYHQKFELDESRREIKLITAISDQIVTSEQFDLILKKPQFDKNNAPPIIRKTILDGSAIEFWQQTKGKSVRWIFDKGAHYSAEGVTHLEAAVEFCSQFGFEPENFATSLDRAQVYLAYEAEKKKAGAKLNIPK